MHRRGSEVVLEWEVRGSVGDVRAGGDAAGERAGAIQEISRAPAGPSAGFKPRELSSGEEIAIAYNKACCHANIGNVEEGLASLLTALERGYDQYPAIRADADIASLREDSRFEVIMARFEPQSTLGKLFDAFNGPKKGVSMLDGIKNIFEK